LDQALLGIAQELGATSAQAVLTWLLHYKVRRNDVSDNLPGERSRTDMRAQSISVRRLKETRFVT
jgi:aryl-alcohol dehydrogenase-like predicted oxidoreductase